MAQIFATNNIRQQLLNQIKGKDRQLKAFEKYNKPGIQNKLLMWVLAPTYYTPYPIARFLSRFRKGKPADVSEVSSVGGPSEIKLTKFLIKNLKPSDVFYDIGANKGFYTLLALHFCETHAFEPIPEVFAMLFAASQKRERKPFLTNIALADKRGEDTFYVNSADSGSSTLIAARTEIDRGAYSPIKVHKMTLDEYLETNHPPTIIKMDVEGAEDIVIEGGEGIFTKTVSRDCNGGLGRFL